MKEQEKTIERHDVEDTPFSVIVDAESGKAKICVGNQLITDKEFNNEKEARKAINKKDWELILNMSIYLAHNIYNTIINQSKKEENGTN